ncbi:MAG: hypothetical protein WC091_26345 [Sulfuricellaceae bacterium]
MATTPSYAATPNCAIANITTANTARDGTGTVSPVFTAGAAGAMVSRLSIVARASTSAGIIRFFIHNGATAFLWKEVAVSAVTPSGTAVAFTSVTDIDPPLYLPTGYSVRAATNNAESFNIVVEGGNL